MGLNEILFRISSIERLRFIGTYSYSLCTKTLSLLFWLTPEIRSVYLAGSSASEDIVPGLSDVDFVVIVRDLSDDDEYKFVKRLEKRVRYLMPPWGKDKVGTHILIYSTREWTLLGDIFLGKRYGQPRKVFEKDRIQLKYNFDSYIKGLHHFYKALWRLTTIQQDVSRPVKSKFDHNLRLRMMDRCYLAIINGFKESSEENNVSSSYKELVRDIGDKLKNQDVLNEESYTQELLPELIHFFHLAVFNSLPVSQDGGKPNKIKRVNNSDAFNKSKTEELAKECSSLIDEISGKNTLFTSRAYQNDFFLYDTKNYELSRKLIGHYRQHGKESLRILSEHCFEHFLLTRPLRRCVLIKFPAQIHFQAEGSYTHESFILDAYAIFPQLRSPGNVGSVEKYYAHRNTVSRLLDFTGSEKFPARGNDSGISCNSKSEYDRFKKLKGFSLELRMALSNYLKERRGRL